MKTNKARAIVLRRTNYGEADRIIHLLTPSGGVSVIAKGVRREKSRLAGGIELFAICEVVYTEGKGDIKILTSSRLIKFYKNIIKDYDKMQFAYLAIKLISRISESAEDLQLYEILGGTLAGLDSNTLSIDLVQAWFYLHYAALTGHELSLYFDANGDDILPELTYKYDAGERGLLIDAKGALNADHIKLLRLISTKPLKTLAQIGGISNIISDCFYVAREHASI